MSYQLLVDTEQRVLVIRLGAALTQETLLASRADAKRFAARMGNWPSILDFSAVERSTLDGAFIAGLAQQAPVFVGTKRVIVAARPEVFGISRMYEMNQDATADIVVVRTMAAAYEVLGIRPPKLEPVKGLSGATD